MNTSTIIQKVDDCWVGWIEEVSGMNCQENSKEKLLESLKVTLQETLEFNKQGAFNAAGSGYHEEKVAV